MKKESWPRPPPPPQMTVVPADRRVMPPAILDAQWKRSRFVQQRSNVDSSSSPGALKMSPSSNGGFNSILSNIRPVSWHQMPPSAFSNNNSNNNHMGNSKNNVMVNNNYGQSVSNSNENSAATLLDDDDDALLLGIDVDNIVDLYKSGLLAGSLAPVSNSVAPAAANLPASAMNTSLRSPNVKTHWPNANHNSNRTSYNNENRLNLNSHIGLVPESQVQPLPQQSARSFMPSSSVRVKASSGHPVGTPFVLDQYPVFHDYNNLSILESAKYLGASVPPSDQIVVADRTLSLNLSVSPELSGGNDAAAKSSSDDSIDRLKRLEIQCDQKDGEVKFLRMKLRGLESENIALRQKTVESSTTGKLHSEIHHIRRDLQDHKAKLLFKSSEADELRRSLAEVTTNYDKALTRRSETSISQSSSVAPTKSNDRGQPLNLIDCSIQTDKIEHEPVDTVKHVANLSTAVAAQSRAAHHSLYSQASSGQGIYHLLQTGYFAKFNETQATSSIEARGSEQLPSHHLYLCLLHLSNGDVPPEALLQILTPFLAASSSSIFDSAQEVLAVLVRVSDRVRKSLFSGMYCPHLRDADSPVSLAANSVFSQWRSLKSSLPATPAVPCPYSQFGFDHVAGFGPQLNENYDSLWRSPPDSVSIISIIISRIVSMGSGGMDGEGEGPVDATRDKINGDSFAVDCDDVTHPKQKSTKGRDDQEALWAWQQSSFLALKVLVGLLPTCPVDRLVAFRPLLNESVIRRLTASGAPVALRMITIELLEILLACEENLVAASTDADYDDNNVLVPSDDHMDPLANTLTYLHSVLIVTQSGPILEVCALRLAVLRLFLALPYAKAPVPGQAVPVDLLPCLLLRLCLFLDRQLILITIPLDDPMRGFIMDAAGTAKTQSRAPSSDMSVVDCNNIMMGHVALIQLAVRLLIKLASIVAIPEDLNGFEHLYRSVLLRLRSTCLHPAVKGHSPIAGFLLSQLNLMPLDDPAVPCLPAS